MNMKSILLLSVGVTLASPLVAEPASEGYWTQTGGGYWWDPANWKDKYNQPRTPEGTDHVIIPSECANSPTVNASLLMLNSVTVSNGAHLVLQSSSVTVTNALTVAGAFAVTGATTVRCEGDVSVTGTFDGPECTLLLAGGRGQTADLGGRAFTEIVAEKSGGTLAFASGFTAATLRLAADILEGRGDVGRYRALWLRDNRPGGLEDSIKKVFN